MRIEPTLRRIHHRPTDPRPEHAEELEAQLLSKFDARPVKRRRRFWLLGVGAVALAGACVAPASYEMDMGYSMTIALDEDGNGAELSVDPKALAAHIQDNFPVDDFKILARKSLHETDAGQVATLKLQLILAGPFDIDEVEASVVEAFPALGDAQMEVEVLDGTVQGTVGGLLGQRALGLELDDESIEQTRARIVADLQARGLADNARIQITEEETPHGRRREVRVEVEKP